MFALPCKPDFVLLSWRNRLAPKKLSCNCFYARQFVCCGAEQAPKKRIDPKNVVTRKTWQPNNQRTPAGLKSLRYKSGTFLHHSTSGHSITTEKTITEEEQVLFWSPLPSADFTILFRIKHWRIRIRLVVILLLPIAC